ncbi:hypothetical protein KAR91_44215 [Candidatus Pacearchaeota archaeon]|nr:hypothetical protein [Candidatus Pacearchaeota archaeon]
MITVTHERVTEETFKLIELELFYKDHRVMLRVPETMTEEYGESLRKRANSFLPRNISIFCGEKE